MEVSFKRLAVGFGMVFLLGVLFAVLNGFYVQHENSQLPFIVYVISLVSIVVGAILVFLFKEKIQKAQLERLLNVLPEDQKLVITALIENNNMLEQNRIVAFTGLKKVRVSRVLQKLEARGIIQKRFAGNTNLVILKL